MNRRRERQTDNHTGVSFNIYTIWNDVRRFIWAIISISISGALLAFVAKDFSYKPVYRIESTYYITSRGINNDLLSNMSTAQNMAARYSQIFKSETIKNMAAQDVGIPMEDFIISSEVVPETNIVVVRTTAESPELAYRLMESVIANYPSLSKYLVTDAIINELTPLKVPTRQTYKVNLVVTMLKGFVLAFGVLSILAVAYSCLRDTIRSGADIEHKLDSRLLGEIPYERKNLWLNGNNKRKSILINSQAVSFRYVEAVGKIGRKVIYSMERNKAKTLLVTSCLENEGKSTVVANLALAISGQGKKVVIVDFDLKKPAQYKIFDILDKSKISLENIIEKEGDISSVQIPGTNVNAILNDKKYYNSTELLTTEKMGRILGELKKGYDFILLDTPPVPSCADAETIASVTDAYMIVVREHMALSRQINDVIDILYNCPGHTIGCVFNATHNKARQTFGGRGYESNYSNDYYGEYYKLR